MIEWSRMVWDFGERGEFVFDEEATGGVVGSLELMKEFCLRLAGDGRGDDARLWEIDLCHVS